VKVARYHDKNDIRIVEVPVPEIVAGELLIKMKACGICGTDLLDWYLVDRAPLVLGHEPVGVVVETGGANAFDEGDRVFTHHHVACLTCRHCVREAFTMCPRFRQTHLDPGGFAEFIRVPSPNVQIDTLLLPDTMSFVDATLIEPVGCCIRAIRKCAPRLGDDVAIIGAGVSGMLHLHLLREFGVGKIIVSDLYDCRLDMAANSGADVVINPGREDYFDEVMKASGGDGAEVVVVTAPSAQALLSGLDVCAKGGTLCVFAPTSPEERLWLSPNRLFFSEIRIVASYSTSHVETRTALKLVGSSRLGLSRLITDTLPLSRTRDAFSVARERRASLKVVVQGES
jgi:L-iditol 2-dehydrogenase